MISSTLRLSAACAALGLSVLVWPRTGVAPVAAQTVAAPNGAPPMLSAPLLAAQTVSVHDPVMIQQGDTFYLFATGNGISAWSSKDMKNWQSLKPVFAQPPAWATKAVPGFRGHIWAPDISFHNGLFYLYYSVSAFEKNTSAIGVTVNKTLDPASPDFKWEDKGKVIQSEPNRDQWNAIDPNLILDDAGTPWLSFGSFWGGLKLVKLNPDLVSVAEPQQWHSIARRPRTFTLDDAAPGDGAIEAPFIFKKGAWYYLFVSFDYCCRGERSDYKIAVGRSASVTGPYLDKDGVRLDRNGGTVIAKGDKNWYGVGHTSTYTFGGKDLLIFHAYDANDRARPKLRVEELQWDAAGWPTLAPR